MSYLPDHGLPLVQLKEQRRELVIALQSHVGPIEDQVLHRLAALQQSISAIEDVIADLDYEMSGPHNDNAIVEYTHFHPLGAASLTRGLEYPPGSMAGLWLTDLVFDQLACH